MKYITKIALSVMVATLPVFAMADTVAVATPTNISPADNAMLTSLQFTSADWTDVTVGSTSASYHYESSHSSTTKADGSFVSPLFVSPLLASSSIVTSGTNEGVYYWHVRAVDVVSGSTSSWSLPWKVTIDTTKPTIPGTLTLTSSVAPASTTSSGQQVWSFGTSSDALSGVARYEYNVSGTSTWINNALNTTFTTTLGVGSYQLFVRAIDTVGNVGLPASASLVVTASGTTATSTSTLPPTNMNQCKKMGWKTFAAPKFKNQGSCVSFVEKMLRDKKKEENRMKQADKSHEREARKAFVKREIEIRTIRKHHEEKENERGNASSSPRNGTSIRSWNGADTHENQERESEHGKGKSNGLGGR